MLFVLHNLPDQTPEIPGLTLCPLEVDSGTARFDITLDLWDSTEGLRGWIEYDTELFEAATISRLDDHWQTLLKGVVQAPQRRLAELPLLTTSEYHQLCTGGQGTVVAPPHDACVHRRFEIQALRIPDAMALIEADRHLTYGELNCRANQVAYYLRAQGVSAGECVGLYMSRSIDMVVGLRGILKADAAYVPLDPAYPEARLALMGRDAQVSVVLTQVDVWAEAPTSMRESRAVCLDADWPRIACQATSNPLSQATSAYWATILYTSGSTGQPKGIPSAHNALVNVLSWLGQAFPFSSHEMACHKTAISFVDAVRELLAPLLHGIPVVIVPDSTLHDPAEFVRLLDRHRVTRILLETLQN